MTFDCSAVVSKSDSYAVTIQEAINSVTNIFLKRKEYRFLLGGTGKRAVLRTQETRKKVTPGFEIVTEMCL